MLVMWHMLCLAMLAPPAPTPRTAVRSAPLRMAGEPPRRRSDAPPLQDGPRVARFEQEAWDYYANPPTFEGTGMTITEFPNPILRAPNADITEFDDELLQLCKEFFNVMYGANGVGLAAPQVGLNLRLFVYNVDPSAPGALRKMGERVVINPRIIEYGAATDVDLEGCLSSRSECCCGDVRRAKSLKVEYLDERGRPKQKTLKGFEARVFQHEYDHIEGVLHIDRQSSDDRALIRPYLDQLIAQHGEGGVLELPPDVLEQLQPPAARVLEASASARDIVAALGTPPKATPPPKPRPPSTKAAAAAASKAGAQGFGGGGGGGFGASGKGAKGGAKKKKR